MVNITKNKIKNFPKKSVELARPDELAADELAQHPCTFIVTQVDNENFKTKKLKEFLNIRKKTPRAKYMRMLAKVIEKMFETPSKPLTRPPLVGESVPLTIALKSYTIWPRISS